MFLKIKQKIGVLIRYRQNSLTAFLLLHIKGIHLDKTIPSGGEKEVAFHIQDIFPKIAPKIAPEESLPSHAELCMFVVMNLKVTKMSAEVKIYWNLFHF